MTTPAIPSPPENNRLLILDDNAAFRQRLERVLTSRGFDAMSAESLEAARQLIKDHDFTHAVMDLRLEDGSGLDAVEVLHAKNPDAMIIVLTGYGAIATAVAAVKLGAQQYLSKPSSDADDIHRALLGLSDEKPEISENPMSADRVKWEHIQSVYEACDRNVSETARRLNMHRRTLQRILAKHAPRD